MVDSTKDSTKSKKTVIDWRSWLSFKWPWSHSAKQAKRGRSGSTVSNHSAISLQPTTPPVEREELDFEWEKLHFEEVVPPLPDSVIEATTVPQQPPKNYSETLLELLSKSPSQDTNVLGVTSVPADDSDNSLNSRETGVSRASNNAALRMTEIEREIEGGVAEKVAIKKVFTQTLEELDRYLGRHKEGVVGLGYRLFHHNTRGGRAYISPARRQCAQNAQLCISNYLQGKISIQVFLKDIKKLHEEHKRHTEKLWFTHGDRLGVILKCLVDKFRENSKTNAIEIKIK